MTKRKAVILAAVGAAILFAEAVWVLPRGALILLFKLGVFLLGAYLLASGAEALVPPASDKQKPLTK